MAKSLPERLCAAQQTLAELVLIDPVYLPIFERIDAEVRSADSSANAIDRARAVAARYKTTG